MNTYLIISFQHFLRLFLSLFIVRNGDPTLKSHFGQGSLEDFQAFRGFWKARNSCLESVSNTHFWWQSHTFSYLKLTLVFWFFVHNQFKISDVARTVEVSVAIFFGQKSAFCLLKICKICNPKIRHFLPFYCIFMWQFFFSKSNNFLKFLKKF